METRANAPVRKAAQLASSICLLALAACGGGGGGSTTALNTTPTTPATTTPTTPATTTPTTPATTTPTTPATTTPTTPATTTPTVNANLIGPPGAASIGTNSPNIANGTTSNFAGNSAASVNTVFALRQSALNVTPSKVSDAGISTATATFKGLVSGSNVPLLDLNVPALSLNIPNIKGDASIQTLANGDKINGSFRQLDYTITGQWGYTASGSTTTVIGALTTGYQTPTANVPTTGTADYVGNGGPGSAKGGFAAGRMYTPDGSGGITGGSVTGTANVNVNFASGAVTGVLNGMQSNAGTTPLPWNDVKLTGTMSGAAMSGTTSTTGAPSGAGALGFSSAATGTFNGALYGPGVNEVGAVWSLAEPTTDGGRAVQGTFMGTHQ